MAATESSHTGPRPGAPSAASPCSAAPCRGDGALRSRGGGRGGGRGHDAQGSGALRRGARLPSRRACTASTTAPTAMLAPRETLEHSDAMVHPGGIQRRGLFRIVGAATLGTLVPRHVLASELTRDEQWRLANLRPIHVPLDLELPQGSYFGGLAYQQVMATVEEVMAVAGDPRSYTSILSATREAQVIARSGRDLQVRLRQGDGRVNLSNVVLVRRETSNLIRFWLDPSEPHDLDDGWGYLHAAPWSKPPWIGGTFAPGPRSILTWGVLMRIDAGLVKRRFAEAIRRDVMDTPTLVGRYIAEHRRAPT